MPHFRTISSCLLTILLGSSTLLFAAPPPTPAMLALFRLPLSDRTLANALILPGPNADAWLCYATDSGTIVSYRLTATIPTPPPEPPPIPPTPPPVVAVITITETTPAALPPNCAARLAATNSSYAAYTVAMVAEANPPTGSLLWIGRTAGKAYPWTFIATPDGKILWQGATPISSAAFLAQINSFLSPTTIAPDCAESNCPSKRTRRR